MSNREWPANDYAIGSYIQAQISNQYLKKLQIKPTDAVLDVGCGNGAFSLKLIETFPMASFKGIDASKNMLVLAKEMLKGQSNVSLEQADVATMTFENQFDYIVSFWCFQWVRDIQAALNNLYRALKKGGKIFAIFPYGDDPFITTFMDVKQSGQFPSLEQFISPVDYPQLGLQLKDKSGNPFQRFTLERHPQSLTLPSLDTFRKFVNGIAFYQGQIPGSEIEEINEAMVDVFRKKCQEQFQGKWRFEMSNYFLTAEK